MRRAGIAFSFSFGARSAAALAGLVAAAVAASCGGGSSIVNGAVPGNACVYQMRTIIACPGQPIAYGEWTTQCADANDCSKLPVPAADTVEGCTRDHATQGAHTVTGTCASVGTGSSGVPADGGEAGTGGTTDGAPPAPCAPGPVGASFAPQWHAPRAKQAGACSLAQIDAFRQCIDDSATAASPPSCQPWASPQGADATCLSCLQSQTSDAEWGPLILSPTESTINVVGCLALAEGKPDGTGCAGSLNAANQCDRAACYPTCPLGSSDPAVANAEVQQELACETSAQSTVCATYTTQAACAGAIKAGDAGTPDEAKCFGVPAGTPDVIFENVALAFCGP